jgi:hypothetical protein
MFNLIKEGLKVQGAIIEANRKIKWPDSVTLIDSVAESDEIDRMEEKHPQEQYVSKFQQAEYDYGSKD